MLRLYILRHAKAGWAAPGKTDFERSLNERGVDDIALVGAEMAAGGMFPQKVLCSPSSRTRETLKGVLEATGISPAIEYPASLYSGTPEDYLEAISMEDDVQSLMIIGHNPTCAILAYSLCRDGDASAMQVLRERYPTGALAVIDIDAASWADLREGCGLLRRFIYPKALRPETAG
jgi:phosphohistidine phosphatase